MVTGDEAMPSRITFGHGLTAALLAAMAVLSAANLCADSRGGSKSPAAQSANPVAPQASEGAQAKGSAPKIEVASPMYDFGTVIEGTPVQHVFTIRNAGGADLIIKAVHTSCGCTVAKPTKVKLAPGDSSELAATFDTRFEKGHRWRTITVYTNDPSNPATTLTMGGEIKVLVEAVPSEVSFGTVRRGTEQNRQVKLVYAGEGPLHLNSIASASPNIKVSTVPTKGDSASQVVEISLLKTMPAGPFYDTVQLVTPQKTVIVPVFGRIAGDLDTEPPQVSFGIVPRGRGAERILRLTNSGQRPVKVLSISSTSPNVAAKVEETKPGKEYKITVELSRGAPQGQVRGKLLITTDDPQEKSLSVSFYGIVGALNS
jgi:hypothetical protein